MSTADVIFIGSVDKAKFVVRENVQLNVRRARLTMTVPCTNIAVALTQLSPIRPETAPDLALEGRVETYTTA